MPVPRPDLAALLIREPGHPEIYLVNDSGYKCHVPDPATLLSVFGGNPTVTETTEVPNVSEGPALTPGAVLAQPQGQAPIYLVSNGMKRHIANPAVLIKYQFRGPVAAVAHVLLDFITSGPDISGPT